MTELPQVNFDVPAPKLAFRYYERVSRSAHLLPLSGRIAGSSAYGIKAGTPFLLVSLSKSLRPERSP
jgi:hypothetical protein